MTLIIKRRIAREWLIFLVCILIDLIGLTVVYFTVYFPANHYEGTRLVDVSESEAKQLKADKEKADSQAANDYLAGRPTKEFAPPTGYQRVTGEFDPELYRKLKAGKYSDLFTEDDYHKHIWKREVPVYRRRTPSELFDDLWRYHRRWLWLYASSPYLGLCVVRSIILSVNTLRRR
jgi:hypothetical protein